MAKQRDTESRAGENQAMLEGVDPPVESAGAPAPGMVKMRRIEPIHPGGPKTADVHPDEVENFKAAGWHVPE